MSQKPIVMEQLKQILQLKYDGVGIREIARRTGISRNSVRKYLALLSATPGDENSKEFSNAELADKAYSNDLFEHDAVRLEQLGQHFWNCQFELLKTGVTRQLLWQEYLSLHPDGYSYSRYCYHLKRYLKNSDLSPVEYGLKHERQVALSTHASGNPLQIAAQPEQTNPFLINQ